MKIGDRFYRLVESHATHKIHVVSGVFGSRFTLCGMELRNTIPSLKEEADCKKCLRVVNSYEHE